MSTHTPGPWVANCGAVETVERRGSASSVIAYGIESNTDARLVAAAPDLLAALTELYRLGEQENIDEGELQLAVRAASKAIAKARGSK